MEKKGLISVVIPVYNVEQYLCECVDSVLNQTYQNFEIILVDDGSSDRSGKICDEYAAKDSRIRCIHKENGGLSATRNAGLCEAIGEYVYFLDSDDWIIPDAFAYLIQEADQSQADVVFFEAESFDELGCKAEGNYAYQKNYGRQHGKETLTQLIENKEFHSSVPLLFARHGFLMESQLKFTEGIIYEDMIYTFKLLYSANKVAHLAKKLYRRRYRQSSIMTSPVNTFNFQSANVVYRDLLLFGEQNHILGFQAIQSYLSRCAMNCFNIHKKLTKQEKKKCQTEYERLKESIKSHRFFSDGSLHARCYGVVPWFLYKCYTKIVQGIHIL